MGMRRVSEKEKVKVKVKVKGEFLESKN